MECSDCEWITYMGHHKDCSRYDKEQQEKLEAQMKEDEGTPYGA